MNIGAFSRNLNNVEEVEVKPVVIVSKVKLEVWRGARVE